MPRFIVPRSTRTMPFTVTPRSLVKSAMSTAAGSGAVVVTATKQGFSGAVAVPGLIVNVQSVPCFALGW